MTDLEYREHLKRLVVALVRKHGMLTIVAIHEMANQIIIRHGIREAVNHV